MVGEDGRRKMSDTRKFIKLTGIDGRSVLLAVDNIRAAKQEKGYTAIHTKEGHDWDVEESTDVIHKLIIEEKSRFLK
jgi:hypothetical protein